MKEQKRSSSGLTIWQLVVLALSVYVLLALLVDTVAVLPEATSTLLLKIDTMICVVFIGDFLVQFIRDPRPNGYLKWGWIDLLGSIPYLPWLRWARIVRIIRIVRLLRAVRSAKAILTLVFANRAKGTFTAVAVATFTVMITASIAILDVETAPDSNIRTPADALWWSFVTIATVGYGDLRPVTTVGRIIAVILMTAGIGLFGTFTAYLASFFIAPRKDSAADAAVMEELQKIKERLDRLENGRKS